MDKWIVKSKGSKQEADDDVGDTSSGSEEMFNEASVVIETKVGKKIPLQSLKKTRKYRDEFLKYGFICSIFDAKEQPICLICKNRLSNESLKPTKLKRHLETRHKEFSKKSVTYFKSLAESMEKENKLLKKYTSISRKALSASLEVSYQIGKAMKPYTIGESLILPAAIKITSIMLGEKYTGEISAIPLSRDTVSRRINQISQNIETILISRIQNSPIFALQLDETTDVAKLSQLIVYVRYIYKGKILEDFLFCKKLEGRASGEKIFQLLNGYFDTKQLDRNKCSGICTDGAAALTGINKGLKGLIKHIAPHIEFIHCILHRQALVSKDIDGELNKTLQDVITVINYIKSNSLNSRLFTILCNEMGSAYETLLLHTEVRWLSRGKILRRIFELRSEVHIFLSGKKHFLSNLFINKNWICKLCYLIDIFERLNDLNASLQGENITFLDSSNKIDAFTKKLTLWQKELVKNNTNMFVCFSEYIAENNIDFILVKDDISNHLQRLKENFSKRFKNFPENELGWIIDPFAFDIINSDISLTEKEQLIEISSDQMLKAQFKSTNYQEFWTSIEEKYIDLKLKALNTLIQFPSTYLCESGFSKLICIKTKYRARLDPEDDLRLAISKIKPDFEKIMSSLQPQSSH